MSIIPELLVANLQASLAFWRGLLGFKVRYERPEEGFSFLHFSGNEIMLEEVRPGSRQWITAKLERPLGRGINLQIEVADIEQPMTNLKRSNWPLFMAREEKWYRAGIEQIGQAQFLVQDPDGYLLRLCQSLGKRPL